MKTFALLFFACISCLSVAAQAPTDSTTIYFDFDKHHLRSSEKVKLDAFIADYKNGKIAAEGIVVKGHTDISGPDSYNELLARKRTFTVHEYLLNNGIPKSVVSIESFGERIPVNENKTRQQRQLNRRVEIFWAKPVLPDETAPKVIPKTEPPKEIPKDPVKDFSKEAMDTVKPGDILRLRNINFYGGRHTLLPTAIIPLEELLEVMKANPTLVIEIQGHICCRPGSDIDGADFDANDNNLSRNRARAVYDYLVENGIDKKRMSYRGFAGTKPLVYPEYTESDRTANRRVEIKIVSK